MYFYYFALLLIEVHVEDTEEWKNGQEIGNKFLTQVKDHGVREDLHYDK